MEHSLNERTLALAGIYQATALVQKIACHGMADLTAQEVSIRSLFATDAPDTVSVFGGISGLALGLRTLIEQFSHPEKRDIELTRYVISIMALERKLAKRPDLLHKISDGITLALNQAEHFSISHENVLANLADLYVNTISTLAPRIIVRGEHGHLSNPDNANRVRTLLLAAIRSAVLWYQCGGRRWQLLFQRNKVIESATQLQRSL